MKRSYSLLIIAVLCAFGFFMIVFLVFQRVSSPQRLETVKPSIEPNHNNESTLKFQEGTRGKLYDKLTSERILSSSDELKRTLIISEIGSESGTLYSSPNVLLGYLSSPDYFQAEINTANIDSAKKEVVDWFLSKGISQAGICNLPIMFLLNQEATSEFIDSGRKFNPLAPGC